MQAQKSQRCAIYTRVSTDAGLEQDFNSLDAQREASEAYIKSQAHEGWRPVSEAYDDGGFSGGTMERPALQRLLADIRVRKVDIIVVYKVDRLTRSLADFAKLVDILDQHQVSFVSVTQAFNTTTSMGRLTLNVLLSFAQFEREVTAERIRDKIAASKKKGIWMGGTPPLGYRVEKRKLVINSTEAQTVRMIFTRYLELGSMLPLLSELYRTGVITRLRQLSTGKAVGGVPFTKGPLNHLLKNRTYIGQLNHKTNSYPGEHLGIIDRETFDAVQAQLAKNRCVSDAKRMATGVLLLGKIFDDRGNRMTPGYTKRKEVRFHYYASRLLIEGRRSEAGSVPRVAGCDVDDRVIDALVATFNLKSGSVSDPEFRRESVAKFLRKVVVQKDQLALSLNSTGVQQLGKPDIVVPWAPRRGRPKREILLPHTDGSKDQRPIRVETRTHIVKAVACGRRWLRELVSGSVPDAQTLAIRERRSKRSIYMHLSLAFIAPDIVEALVEGKLPRGIGITRLINLPAEWASQREALGVVRGARGR